MGCGAEFRKSILVFILILLSFTSARPSSHFLHMKWAKDTGVLIRCITTFSATPTTDLFVRVFGLERTHRLFESSHTTDLFSFFHLDFMKVQTELTESGVQSISDLPSFDPVRVSDYIHIGVRRVFFTRKNPPVLLLRES